MHIYMHIEYIDSALGLDTYDWLGPAVEDSPGPGVRRTGVLGPFCMVWGVFLGSFGLELQIWG